MHPSLKQYFNDKRLYKTFFILLFFASVLPFLALAFYSHPVADDYVFSSYYKSIGWLAFQKYFYLNWQGTYTTNAIMCSPLNPVVHNRFDLYWLVCWFALISMVASIWFLVKYLTRNALAASIVTSTILVVYLYQAPSPAQGFYWLNVNWGYQMSLSVSIVLVLVLLRTFEHGMVRRDYWLLAAGLTALLMGTNFIIDLLLGFGLGVLTLLSMRNPKTRLWWAGLLLIACVGLAIVVFAPGNAVRMNKAASAAAALNQNVSVTSRLAHGVSHGAGLVFYSLINWLGNGVLLAFSILLIPVMSAVAKDSEAPITVLLNKRKLLLLAGAIMVVLPFFPTYLLQNAPPEPRINNTTYLFFLCVWLFALHALVSWLQRASGGNYRQPAYLAFGSAAFLCAALLTDGNYSLTYVGKARDFNNIAVAYKDWLGGKAAEYDSQQQRRYQIMQRPGKAGVELKPLTAQPQTIFVGDIRTDTAFWANKAYAEFFNKPYVRLSE